MKFTLSIKSIIIACLSTITIVAGANVIQPYAVANIPKSLLNNANAIIRVDELIYIIENEHSSKLKMKHAITLLNENASDYLRTRIPFDNSTVVSNIKATVYDSNGEIIYSAIPKIFETKGDYESLASDDKFWVIRFPLRKYPFTVEYEYDVSIRESFFFQDWSFLSQPDVSVESSGVQYVVPKNLEFRTKQLNLKHACDTSYFGNNVVYTWQEENIPAYKPKDLFLISFEKKTPLLLTAPDAFNMGGYSGKMHTWEQFGKWSYDLNKDRDVISAELQIRLKNLTANTTDEIEKVRKVYEYLQKTTRYVSIQLGIGGFQTLEASFVEKKGFGDCKALTNYMKAMLKSIGIKSHQALVLANVNRDIYADFPSPQFNHVILCVPLQRDTIWLECTDQSEPFNFLGSSTNNHHALLLSDQGCRLIKTPEFTSNQNFKKTNINVLVDKKGDAIVNAHETYSGLTYEEPLYYLKEGKKKREEWLNDNINAPNLTIKNIDFSENRTSVPAVDINYSLNIENFASLTLKRIIFNPYIFKPIEYVAEFGDEEFTVFHSESNLDSITYELPENYSITELPKSSHIITKFGEYENSFVVQNSRLIYTRKLTINKGAYIKTDVNPFVEFANAIAKLDRRLILLQKK
jgi:hypothetical protein